MCLEPICAKSRVGHKGNTERESGLHLLKNDALYLLLFFWVDREVEFVVDLKDHLASDALCLKAVEDADHGHLNNISSCTLNGGIDGISLSKTSDGGIVRVDVWQIAATAE